MTTFTLDADEYQHAVRWPYRGCKNPRAAAFGRLAEPFILSSSAAECGFTVCSVDSYDPASVPPQHQAEVCRSRRHDGLVFCGEVFIGVIEAKTQMRNRDTVSLSDTESRLFQYCSQHQLRYYLALGCQTSELKGKFEGVLDLCVVPAKDIFTHPTSWSQHVICTKKMKNLINLQQYVL